MEDQKPCLVLARNWELVQERRLKPIVKMQKYLNWEACLSKEVYCNSNVSQTGSEGGLPTARGYGSLGAKPLAAARFFAIFGKAPI